MGLALRYSKLTSLVDQRRLVMISIIKVYISVDFSVCTCDQNQPAQSAKIMLYQGMQLFNLHSTKHVTNLLCSLIVSSLASPVRDKL